MSSKIQKIIHASLFTPTRNGWGVPILWIAGPGCAKTDIIESTSAKCSLPFESLAPGERGEGAFGVTPVPSADGKFMNYPPPEWVSKFENGGVIFLDELTTAPPAIQPALLGIALAKRIGGYYFGDRVRVIAAANRVEEAAGGWELAPPLANRFGHLNWEYPNAEEWTDWLLNNADKKDDIAVIDAAVEEARVLKKWNHPWAKARGLVGGFVRAKSSLLHKQPNMGHPDASRAWPSHRTWEMATRAIASAEIHGLSEAETDEFAGAFVGQKVISELVEYRKKVDLPDPVDVLDGKVKFKHDGRRLDRTFAVLGSCAALVSPEDTPRREERASVLFQIMHKVAEDAIDVVWPAARALAAADLHKLNKDSKELFRKLFPVTAQTRGVRAA